MSRRTNLAQQSDDDQQDDGVSASHIPLSKRALQSAQRILQKFPFVAVSKASATKPAATPPKADRMQEDMTEQLEDFNAIADTFVPDQLSIDELRHEVTRIKTERKRGKEKP